LKSLKYSAAVASASWLTDAAYPLRVHKVFLHFSNLDLTKNLSPNLLVKLCVDALGNSQNVQNYLCLSCPESQSETTFRTQSFNLNFITFHQKTQGVFREN